MIKTKNQNPWYIGVVSGMASYIDSAAIVSTGTALVMFQKTIGITALQIGILSGLLTLCIALGAFVGGRLGDRVGRRKVFIITMAMIVAGVLLIAFGLQFSYILFGTLLIGLATGADLPVSLATISEAASDKNRGKIIAFSNLLWTAGIGMTMAISAVVGEWGIAGAQIMYLHVGLVALVLLVLRWAIPESPLWLVAREEERKGINTIRAQTSSLKDLLRGKYLWPFVALCLFYTLTNLAANTSGQFGAYVAVNVVGISISTHSMWNLIIMPMGVIFGLIFMRVVDTPYRMKFYVLGAVLMVSGYILPVFLNFSAVSWFCCLLFSCVGSALAFEGIMKVWSQESFPTMLRSTAQGIIVAVARLSCGLLAFVTPVLLNSGPSMLYISLTTMVTVGLLIGWVCFKGQQRNEFKSESQILETNENEHPLSTITAKIN